MLTEDQEVEPIVPMGQLVTKLKCKMHWEEGELSIQHPQQGDIKVVMTGGCPHVPRQVALQLINELEDVNKGISVSGGFAEEEDWMRKLIDHHPVLRSLPDNIRQRLVVNVGSWNDLPSNRRQRRRWQRDGLMVHMLCDQGVYGGLLRTAVEGKLDAVIGGFPCRTRSVLRHYDIPGQPDCPRPIRAWGGEEFGIKDATEEERKKLQEDDVMAWRMVFLFIVASYVRKARGIPEEVQFTLEQPSSPKEYKPEVVSWWDTWQWKELKKEFDFKETRVRHREFGGQAEKPTTFGGNLTLRPDEHYVGRGGGEDKVEGKKIRSSKDFSRWPPGIMAMVACALQRSVPQKKPH